MNSSISIKTREEIVAADDKFTAAFSRGDANAVAQFYTEQGQVFLSNFDIVTGRQGIQMIWQGAMTMMGFKNITLETVELEEHGDIVYEVGKYTLLAKGGRVADVGKYIVIWKQEAGVWKMHRDIMNSNQPAPGQLPNPLSAILKLVGKGKKK